MERMPENKLCICLKDTWRCMCWCHVICPELIGFKRKREMSRKVSRAGEIYGIGEIG